MLALGPQTAGTNLQEMMAITLGPARIRCLFTRYLRRTRSRIADPLHQQSDDPFASDSRLGLTKTYGAAKRGSRRRRNTGTFSSVALRCIYSFIRLR